MTNAVQRPQDNDLTFYSWHEASDTPRKKLREWVYAMQHARDGEVGSGPSGAGAWLDEKVALSRPGDLFQTFLALWGEELVWTGSVVEDDREVRGYLAEIGYHVQGFFGFFNTRYDLRGRGIGWAGAKFVSRYAQEQGDPAIALFTANPAAERHYRHLRFKCIGDIYVPAFDARERLYIRSGVTSADC